MRIALNQIVRAVQPKKLPPSQDADSEGIANYHYLLSNGGKYPSGNIQKPMFYHSNTKLCCPAIYFHSNPLKTDRSVKPWTDVLQPDSGLVYYNGDNQTPRTKPGWSPTSGNAKMEDLWDDYRSHTIEARQKATPILVFEQIDHRGSSNGYRAFRGYGLVSSVNITQEYEPNLNEVFSNYLFEVTLLQIPAEGLDWNWIYDRRNPNLSLSEINRNAPPAWKKWISHGSSILSEVRQHISHHQVSTHKVQTSELTDNHKNILDDVVGHYEQSKDKGRFESLASLITGEFFGEHYREGWITKHSGDMGVDFVGRLDITNKFAPSPSGTILGGTRLVVLGQAKCRTNYLAASESARDIARVAARIQRGQIGVFITTGLFRESTQIEVANDGYPIVLINGRQLADILIQYMVRTGHSLDMVLADRDEWYYNNKRDVPPDYILKGHIA